MKEVKTIPLFVAYAIYILISGCLFVATTSGWIGVYMLLASAIFSISTILVFLIRIISAIRKAKTVTVIPVKTIYLLLLVQFLLLAFNLGDFGDFSGSMFFYQRYLMAWSGDLTVLTLPASGFIYGCTGLTYVLLLFFILHKTIQSIRVPSVSKATDELPPLPQISTLLT